MNTSINQSMNNEMNRKMEGRETHQSEYSPDECRVLLLADCIVQWRGPDRIALIQRTAGLHQFLPLRQNQNDKPNRNQRNKEKSKRDGNEFI
jgi:hypothetical protein